MYGNAVIVCIALFLCVTVVGVVVDVLLTGGGVGIGCHAESNLSAWL